jgi:programmed cell death protein 5
MILMSEEEEIKKRLLQQRMHHMQNEQTQQQQLEETLKTVMHQILEPAARERLSNLKMVKPDMALQLQAYLAQLYQSGQIKGKITDQQVVAILQKLSAAERKEFKITRK